MRRLPTYTACAAAGLLCLAPWVPTDAETLTLNTTISGLAFQGTGDLPLGGDYANVSTAINVSQTPGTTATGQTVITVDTTTFDIDLTSSISFVVDVDLTAQSGGFFGGDPTWTHISLLGDPSTPFTATLTSSIPFAAFDPGTGTIDQSLIPDPTIVLNTIEYSLKDGGGVLRDLNNNGIHDSLFINAMDLNVLDVDALSFGIDESGTVTPTDLETLIAEAFFSGGNVELNAAITSTAPVAIDFTGSVADSVTDPPFSVTLSGTIGTVPLPAALPLFASGLLGLISVARRKRSV